jgi:hypothetical protein
MKSGCRVEITWPFLRLPLIMSRNGHGHDLCFNYIASVLGLVNYTHHYTPGDLDLFKPIPSLVPDIMNLGLTTVKS